MLVHAFARRLQRARRQHQQRRDRQIKLRLEQRTAVMLVKRRERAVALRGLLDHDQREHQHRRRFRAAAEQQRHRDGEEQRIYVSAKPAPVPNFRDVSPSKITSATPTTSTNETMPSTRSKRS